MTQGLVLVTGASGAIGPAVVDALLSAGYAVRTLTRQSPAVPFSQNVETNLGDITDAAAVAAATTGTSAVVHLAARLHFAGAPSRDIAAYRRVNVEGTKTVVRAATDAGVQRVVFASTIAVYGSPLTDVVTESKPPQPDTPYAITKLEAEDIVRAARRADGKPLGTVLRLAAVYGSRVKGNYRSLVRGLARHRFVPIGDGQSRRTLIHDLDVGRAVVHVLQAPAAAGRTYNLTDGGVHTTDEIVAAICSALGRPAPRWHLPAGLAFGAAIALDELHRLTLRGPGTLRDRLLRYVENVAVDGSAIQRELGFVPEHGLEWGWQRVVEDMRASGDLT
jgi:nucleoside-diphosphate-sugar epimerase